MKIIVENKYRITSNSHINVHCSSPKEVTINPTDRHEFSNTDEVVLDANEIHEGAPIRGPKRFDYIIVGAEWRDGDNHRDSITFEGHYDSGTNKATIRILHEEKFKKPKTVNVQVGGN